MSHDEKTLRRRLRKSLSAEGVARLGRFEALHGVADIETLADYACDFGWSEDLDGLLGLAYGLVSAS